jgi:hypothetical protein
MTIMVCHHSGHVPPMMVHDDVGVSAVQMFLIVDQ